jgi:hypothetical protein
MWAEVLMPLNEAQFRYGVLAILRTWTNPYMPPPSAVLAAAYEAPPSEPTQALRLKAPQEPFWDSPEQEERVVAVVRENLRTNPRIRAELPLAYIHRIATLAGLLKEESPKTSSGMEPVAGREPGQEG